MTEAHGATHYGDVLVGFVTFLLFIATAASVVVVWQLGKRQEDLQKRLAHEAGERERQIANEAQERERKQRLFEQRAQLLPLWQYISSLSDIDPAQPCVPDVVKAANTLELIAVCLEAEVIDRDAVMRTFRDKYIDFYEKIDRCGPLEGYRETMTGRQLLATNSAAKLLYQKLEQERLNLGIPKKLDG